MKYSTSNQSNWFHVNFYIIFHENAQQIFFLNSGKKTHIKKCKKCLKLCLCGWTISESQSWRVLGHIRVLGGEASCIIIAVVGGRNGLSTMDRAKNWLPPQRRIRNLFNHVKHTFVWPFLYIWWCCYSSQINLFCKVCEILKYLVLFVSTKIS